MKNIKVVAAVLIAMLAALATGCGKQTDSADVQADDNTVFKMQVDTVINRENEEDQTEQLDEAIAEEPVKFDCMDEIKTASSDSGLVQIDDMLFQYGDKFSDIISVIEQSECAYEAEYSLSSVVPAGERQTIRFNKNGDLYFMIGAENRETQTIELKECIVDFIYACKGSEGNAYYAGFNSNEMTYTTVKDSMKDYEPEKETFGYDSRNNQELGVMYIIPFQESEIYVYYIFDNTLNELKSFQLSYMKLSDAGWPW